MRKWLLGLLLLTLVALPAGAQQTGSVSGKVTMDDGSVLPGVSVEATGNVLPQPRRTVTGAAGEYRLPVLPPGSYELTFSMQGMATAKRSAFVALQQDTTVNVVLALEAIKEQIEVVAQATLVDTESAELKAAVTAETIASLPVGQSYRDLVKLIPGVQYTEDGTRGPSAGGSGQDNVYLFDGVNVNLPLFGTLSSEPTAHDIDQLAVVKGGASATDFNRAAGFQVNSVSRSGTNAFHGMLSYQIQPESLIADRKMATAGVTFEEDKDWITANFGGPILKDHLFFYASYFQPNSTRENRANVYGEVPDYDYKKDEYFGKLTFAPTQSLLLNASYRTSEATGNHASIASTEAASAGAGSKGTLDIATLEASWIVGQSSFITFKATDFANETKGLPDTRFDFTAVPGDTLDIDNLDRMGYFSVPTPVAGQDAFNAFIAPLIERYGFVQDGVRKGGGAVGGDDLFDNDDFFRRSYQIGYDVILGSNVTHELHFGYQWFKDEEDLYRYSNGWGLLSAPGGRLKCPSGTACAGQPYYFQAQVQQQKFLDVPTIHSEYESQNIEINDSIKFANFTVNAGFVISNDKLYGQGLKENADNYSGYEVAVGHKYLMHEIDWADTIQPRLGAVWAYSDANTVYANYARYVPAASSLPRAASWARNLAVVRNVYFDANGNYMGSQQEAGSSGKWFQDGIKPRATDEYLLGTTRDLGGGWSSRLHARYRYAYNFWEDTNNDARILFAAPEGIPQELYIPDLQQIRDEIGGSSYVIAELDGAFTKYYEAGLEAEWRGRDAYFRGTYVWSHYYGNFDQDNSTTANDANVFIGSSYIGDGAGRQLWDYRYGDMRGDRRHQLKVYGYYALPWNGTVGAYAVYQSGQPWETHSYEPYIALTTSTSDVSRYAEPAGSNRTDDHYQIDINYTQDIPIGGAFKVQARLDVFNLLDNQTGYDFEDRAHAALYGLPRDFFDPRRIQIAIKLEF